MSSPVIACARTSCQIGALGEREVHSIAEQLRPVRGFMRPPKHRIRECRYVFRHCAKTYSRHFKFSGHIRLSSYDQIGSLLRRSRTAAARNAAAITSPIHRPGALRNFPGPSTIIGSMGGLPGMDGAPSAPPPRRYASMAAKCEVLKKTFSTAKIAGSGKVAHKNA